MYTCDCDNIHGFCTCGIPNKKYAAFEYSTVIKPGLKNKKYLYKILKADVLIFQNLAKKKGNMGIIYWAMGKRYNIDVWLYFWNAVGNFWEPYHQIFNYGYIKQVMKDKNNIIITESMQPELYEEWRK